MATVVECLWASETCAECMKRDECRDEKRVAMLRSERDAARRAGKAEGKAEAFKEAALMAREVAAAPGRYADMPEKIASALLARAEEVERE